MCSFPLSRLTDEGEIVVRESSRWNQSGFTLIEVMIVVVIIGILAAVAIPNFRKFQLKAKTSEVKVNIGAIRTAEESFFADSGRYSVATASPGLSATPNQKQPFVINGGPGVSFSEIGWFPDGEVYFTYAVSTNAILNTYTVDAIADIDADASVQVWGYVHENATGATVNGFHGCSSAGVYDPAGSTGLLNTVGACAARFGQSVF